VKIVQWSGDCQPPDVAVRMAWQAGVVNINGGDTTITRSSPSWTDIAPLGIDKGPGAYQVFAPNQNENVYTNDWTGPFYGFDRLIETLQMTENPYRFKPINLYYHMYSGTKLAALKALKKVYDYALSQPVFPIYSTEYVAKVLDFRDMAVARDVDAGDAWVVRGNGDLRELRWMAPGAPRLADAQGVVGYDRAAGGTYIHLDGGAARFALAPETTGLRGGSGRLRAELRAQRQRGQLRRRRLLQAIRPAGQRRGVPGARQRQPGAHRPCARQHGARGPERRRRPDRHLPAYRCGLLT
jgi:hypothetical protein